MASIYPEIRAALETHLSSVVGATDIAWENVQYSPQTDVPYVVPRFIPTQRRPAVRGLNPQMRYDGVFQVVCYSPQNSGPSAADDLANLILEAFEATTDISHLSTVVSIGYAERQQGILDSPWYYVIVDVGWYIYN